ncbi:DUF5682 family protein, partial [Micromonospora harpali]
MTDPPAGGPAATDLSAADPRAVADALAASARPYLIGVRHHSPALASVVPALLDAAGAEVAAVELPADFQHWLPYLAVPAARAPLAVVGSHGADGPMGFYPFADFSPELAAIRWARQRGVEVICCDLPLADPGWTATGAAPTTVGGADADQGVPGPRPARYAAGLGASGTGRDGDDMWDRVVEVRAPGCSPEAVRRAALGVGWAMRADSAGDEGVPARDLAREEHMRRVLADAGADGRRVAAVVGAFHAPALPTPDAAGPAGPATSGPARSTAGPLGGAADRSTAPPGDAVATSLVPYAFDLLDSRSGYPAGIRDPRWQQAVLAAGGD